MTDNRNLLKLTDEQRQELRRWAQSRTLPAGDVFRARLILALGTGASYREVAKSLKTSGPTIARWKMRFEQDGMAGLEGRHHGSKPRSATPGAGAGDPASAAETGRRQHPLVLPKTGEPVGSQQVHGAADSGPGATETAPTGTVYGQQ